MKDRNNAYDAGYEDGYTAARTDFYNGGYRDGYSVAKQEYGVIIDRLEERLSLVESKISNPNECLAGYNRNCGLSSGHIGEHVSRGSIQAGGE